MPEESSAAEEHAIIQEITAPLATLPDNAVPEVAEVDFPIALRGYDRLAVDAYVKRTSQLVAELQSTHSPEAAVRRALERVGEEVSGILKRAHEAAAKITAQSRSDAEDRLEAARLEAAQITASAERRLKELDAETDRIWAERHQIVEDAQDLARQLLSIAESAYERFPAAEEGDLEQLGEASVVAALAGEEPASDEPGGKLAFEEPGEEPAVDGPREGSPFQDPAAEPVFGGAPEPAGAEDEHQPQQNPPVIPADDEASTQPFDGEATMVMPPILPDEGESS